MKRIKFLFAVSFLLILIAAVSCKKSHDDDNGNNAIAWSFNWTYGNTDYSAQQYYAFTPGTINLYTIEGLWPTQFTHHTGGAGPRLHPDSYTVGVHLLDSASHSYYIDYYEAEDPVIDGSVTITSNASNLISGSFSVHVQPLLGAPELLTGEFTNLACTIN